MSEITIDVGGQVISDICNTGFSETDVARM